MPHLLLGNRGLLSSFLLLPLLQFKKEYLTKYSRWKLIEWLKYIPEAQEQVADSDHNQHKKQRHLVSSKIYWGNSTHKLFFITGITMKYLAKFQ